jgi:hypothetical protein
MEGGAAASRQVIVELVKASRRRRRNDATTINTKDAKASLKPESGKNGLDTFRGVW